MSNLPMGTSSEGSFFSTRASSPSHHLVAHSVKRALHDFYILPSGTESVNQTPFADDRKGARHTLQRKARSRRVDVGNAYPAKSQLEGAVRDGSHN